MILYVSYGCTAGRFASVNCVTINSYILTEL